MKTRTKWSVAQVLGSPLSVAVFLCVMLLFLAGSSRLTGHVYASEASLRAQADQAMQQLSDGAQAMQENDMTQAKQQFSAAAETVFALSDELDHRLGPVDEVNRLIPGKTPIDSGVYLVESASHLAIAAKHIAKALEPFSYTSNSFELVEQGQVRGGLAQVRSASGIPFSEAVAIASQQLVIAQLKLIEAQNSLEDVDARYLPDEVASYVELGQDVLPLLNEVVGTALDQTDVALTLLGHEQRSTYLFLLQNERELRAGGGFIPMMGYVTVDRGEVREVNVRNSYDYDGQLKAMHASPPLQQPLIYRAFARDANWFADFPMSAERVSWYMQSAGGETPDAVIAVNARLFQELLRVVGPLELDGRSEVFTAESFYELAQSDEGDRNGTQNAAPKAIFGELLTALVQRLGERPELWSDVVETLLDGAFTKDVMVWSQNDQLQSRIEGAGLDGSIEQTSFNAIGVTRQAITSGKGDHLVEQHVRHHASIEEDGTVRNTLEVVWRNTATEQEYIPYVSNPYHQLYRVDIYLPLGSQVTSIGFDPAVQERWLDQNRPKQPKLPYDPVVQEMVDTLYIDGSSRSHMYELSGMLMVSNIIELPIGAREEVSLQYTLPRSMRVDGSGRDDAYGLYVIKQPGAQMTSFETTLHYPNTLQPTWFSGGRDTDVVTRMSGFDHIALDVDRDRAVAWRFDSAKQTQ